MRTTKEVSLSDFDSVEISSAVQAEIRRGDMFSVAITANDDMIDRAVAKKIGTTLKVYIEFHLDLNWLFQSEPVQVKITMPDLVALHVSGASHVDVSGFEVDHDVAVEISGASEAKGDITATNARFEASGASKLTLKGAAKALVAEGSGASQIRLLGFATDEVRVDLSGASGGEIAVREKLDYTVSGASRLVFNGSPRIGRASSSGASSVKMAS